MAVGDLLDEDLEAMVLGATGARAMVGTEVVQSLWSGYGQIVRCRLDRTGHDAAGFDQPEIDRTGHDAADDVPSSVIVKHVRWPDERNHPHHQHPRGWATDRSHERKVRSYQIETSWYRQYASRCSDACRVPTALAFDTRDGEVMIVLDDLDAAGFAGRRRHLTAGELDACLSWLASFHATFLGERPDGLWPVGTYWHLDTRPDELAALPDGPLKSAAEQIDQRLSASPFQTFVHGDAKVANFCFSTDGTQVAAVDFQYVGGGCGMKDLAYFLGSCLDDDECERLAPALLDRYFELLAASLTRVGSSIDAAAVEADWRPLYPVAWTDFSRFLQGWSPGHWKLHRYTAQLEREVLASL